MQHIDIHKSIKEKLDFFKKTSKIPNIIFHGPNGSGKHTIVHNFINDIYNHDKQVIKSYVMEVNCACGKGIKFVREELKFFAKININMNSNYKFKTIILMNADKLTIDAQSAMRRCIELFSNNTRFIIIVDDKYKLLKPILSRFCEIYVHEPILNNKKINLHNYSLDICFKECNFKAINLNREIELKNKLKLILFDNENNIIDKSVNDILLFSSELYENGFSGIDILKYIENNENIDSIKKSSLLMYFYKVKNDFINEKLFIFFLLLFIRSFDKLENISFM